MNKLNLKSWFARAVIAVSGLAVLALALVGSFYLVVAALVIGLSASLLSAAGIKPKPVRVRARRRPLDAEYRVVRRK